MYDVAEVCSISQSKRGSLRMRVTTDDGIPPPSHPQLARHSSAQTTLIAAPTLMSFTTVGVRCPADVLATLRWSSNAFEPSIALHPVAAQGHERRRVGPPAARRAVR